MRSRRKLLVVIAALFFLGCAMVWLLRPAAAPVKLSFVRFNDEGTNGRMAIVHFTNYSTRSFRWDLRTFTLENGVWLLTPRQPDIEYPAAVLRRHGSRNHAIPVPVGTNKWMVELSRWRSDSRLENAIEGVFRVVGLKSPFSDSRRRHMVAELDFEGK